MHQLNFCRRAAFWRSLLLSSTVGLGTASAGAFEAYVIRNSGGGEPPVIQPNNSYPGYPDAVEFIIAAGSQKAALGSSAIDGSALGSLTNIAIVRLDDRSRFTPGSGPFVAPYLNFWITDGRGNYAVVANEPSNSDFQPLYSNGYSLSWNDLKDKPAKIYENSDKSWLPKNGLNLKFADLAGYIIEPPPAAKLTDGWSGLGTGAPRELGTNRAWGVNWVFGDTLSNYVSGAEGYVVANPAVAAPAPQETHLTVTAAQALAANPSNKLAGVAGDGAPGFASGSFIGTAIGTTSSDKAELYFQPADLFGRAIYVGEIASLSYWTKKGAVHTVDPRDWYLVVYTLPFAGDVSTPTLYGARFGAEPYFSANLNAPADAWNQWQTADGDNRLRFFESTPGAPGANFGAYTDPHWLDFITANSLGTTFMRRNQQVGSISLQTGSGWANGFTGKVDGLRIELFDGSVTTVNLEPNDAEAPVALNAAVSPSAVANTGGTVTLTALIDDTFTGGSAIASAEYSLDGGTTRLPMAAVVGIFDEAAEEVTVTFAAPTVAGGYSVCVRGYDAVGLRSNEDCAVLAVYDPTVGFVTGGGWIQSPAGAYAADPSLTGRASFDIVSKYVRTKTNATQLQGNTQFTFSAGSLDFSSSSYEWLVVNQNSLNAQFKGVGTINGTGSYGFMVWATDGAKTATPDTFRIQIWDLSNGNAVVYDNGANQPIGGSSIIVHVPKK